jgi:two-component system, NtrC family, nitrogen regulation response regulator GlnG
VGRTQSVDGTTLRQPRESGGAAAEERLLALTVLLHPDASRVGEVAFLEPRARLSRLEPELAPPSAWAGGAPGERQPLGDRHLSRRPLTLRSDGGGVTLVPPEGGGEVTVDGEALAAPLALAPAAIDRGAVIALGDRVALLLHRRRRPAPSRLEGGGALIGDSDAMDRVRGEIDRVADLDAPVLLGGETGTGKELVARAIHGASRRARGPFVAVNLAAVPPAMAASQLFGHARGAFTGAAGDHEGFFARADGGTLFLDEVGEMPAEAQPVLLRALDSGEVWPLGAPACRHVDVRVVAASDADLAQRAAEGTFKLPLLHRLAGYVIGLPPLRERRDDIARLLIHFLRRELAAAGEPDRLAPADDGASWLGASAMAALVQRDWPGNVRELRNAARRIAIASRGSTRARVDGELPAAPAPPAAPPRGGSDVSPGRLVAALREHGWKTGAAAAALGVSKTTLYALMERTPGIRKARDLSADEILEQRAAAGGDIDRMAAALEVSRRGLLLRMRELGLEGGRGRG